MNTIPGSAPEDVIGQNRLVTVARVLSATVHDVNNALQIIGGSAELLENQAGLTEPGRRATARIRAQAARAAELLDELLALTRSAGEGASRVQLRGVVRKALSFRALMIRRAGLTVVFEEAASPAAEVLGRAGELLQAVINLILDAERALEGRKGAIIIQLDEDAGQAVLRVSDDGPDASAPDGGATVERLVPALIARAHDGELAIGRSPEGNTRTLRLPLSARGGP